MTITKEDIDKRKELVCSIVKLGEPHIKIKSVKFECPNCGAVLSSTQYDEKLREPNRCSCGWKSSFRIISKELIEAQEIVVAEKDTYEEYKVYLEGKELLAQIKSSVGNGVFILKGLVQDEYKKGRTKGKLVILGEEINVAQS